MTIYSNNNECIYLSLANKTFQKLLNLGYHQVSYEQYYTLRQKISRYFCNNFVKPHYILTIFGTQILK